MLDDASPSLYVNVNVADDKAGGYTAGISIELREPVFTRRQVLNSLLRNPEITGANLLENLGDPYHTATWASSSTATMDRHNARRFLRDHVLGLVDEFANNYLAANPR